MQSSSNISSPRMGGSALAKGAGVMSVQERLDTVDKLKSKRPGTSNQSARDALERCGWDVQTALVWLEREKTATLEGRKGYGGEDFKSRQESSKASRFRAPEEEDDATAKPGSGSQTGFQYSSDKIAHEGDARPPIARDKSSRRKHHKKSSKRRTKSSKDLGNDKVGELTGEELVKRGAVVGQGGLQYSSSSILSTDRQVGGYSKAKGTKKSEWSNASARQVYAPNDSSARVPPRPPPSSLLMSVAKPCSDPNLDSIERGVRPPHPVNPPIAPGAVAIDGADASLYDDTYTLSPPIDAAYGNTDPPVPMEPVAAAVVQDSQEQIDMLQDQVRQQGAQLEDIRRERENVAFAQVMDNDGEESSVPPSFLQKHKKTYIVGTVVFLLICIALGVAIPLTMPSPEQTATPTPQPSTTTFPPAEPTPSPSEELIELLSSISFDGGEALQTPRTPQNNAVNWLSSEPNVGLYSDTEKIQRFVLATLYYSTLGNLWFENVAWLSENDECLWYNTADGQFCKDGRVAELDLYDGVDERGNNLIGTIPNEIALLSNSLEEINLSNNSLVESIPSELGLLTALVALELHTNKLTGSVPSEFSNLEMLTTLNVMDNRLTGTIPSDITRLTNLELLDVSSNKMIGPIPPNIGFLTRLEKLEVSENQLTGVIPSTIGLLTDLTELWIFTAGVAGTIPSEIGLLTKLSVLGLADNKLSGTLPSEIANLQSLGALALHDNELTGTIPTEFDLLTNLAILSLFDNNLSGNYSCPVLIEHCYISCEDFPENTNQACRFLP